MPSRRKPLKTQKAAIGWLADAETSTNTLSHIGQDVIEKVRKCFARASHENANEAESRAAFKMASRIMEQHKVSQADLVQAEEKHTRDKRGGMSTVAIWPPKLTDAERESGKEEAQASMQAWVSWLAGAIQKFFDCRAYSTQLRPQSEWTFYGIAEHTVSAAIAFEAIHNQIQDWAGTYKGISTRNSYCQGVADGLLDLSAEEKKATEDKAKAYEARALAARIREEDIKRQVELNRLREDPLSTQRSESESDHAMDVDDGDVDNDDYGNDGIFDFGDVPAEPTADEGENEVRPDFIEDQDKPALTVDTNADFEDELQKFIIPEETSKSQKANLPSRAEYLDDDDDPLLPSTEPAEDQVPEMEETAEWKSMRQLTVFREMSKDIEDSVLAAHKVKLRKGRKKKHSVKDKDAYKEGVEDSEKIEVRAARIEEGKYDIEEDSTGSVKRPTFSEKLPVRRKKKVDDEMDTSL